MDTTLKRLSSIYPEISDFVSVVPHLPISLRKTILTATRVQREVTITPPPYPTRSILWERMSEELSTILPLPRYHPYANQHITLAKFLATFNSFLSSPVKSGFLSMLVRNLPFIEEDVNNMLEETLIKELDAAINVYHPTSFSWDFLFRYRPLPPQFRFHEDYPIDQDLHYRIHQAFRSTIPILQNRVFYPQYSRKSIGHHARTRLGSFMDCLEGSKGSGDVITLERLYAQTGIKIDGVTELRSAFKYNDIRPRVYYARGPSVYYPSRYIQEVFNILLDSFPMVGRYSRHLVDVIRATFDQEIFIYDYSSFTSTLHEIRNFTAALARYFEDVFITLVDSREGPISINLGVLLNDFNAACNVNPQFDTGGINGIDLYEETILQHNCGMLGVPGNISSCTLLHGLHLAVLVMSMEACRCVGDDAIGAKQMSDLYEFVTRLSNIGVMSLPKTVIWEGSDAREAVEGEDWHYVKRPVHRTESRVVLGYQAIFPPLAVVFSAEDRFHTSFPISTKEQSIMRSIRYLRSFINQFYYIPLFKEEDIEFANQFLACCKRSLKRKHRLGDIRQENHFCAGLLASLPEQVDIESFEETVRNTKGTIVEIPVDASLSSNFDELSYLCSLSVYTARSNPALKLGVDMEFVESFEKTRRILVEEEHLDLIRDFYMGKIPKIYDFVVEDSAPSWYRRLLLGTFQDSAMVASLS